MAHSVVTNASSMPAAGYQCCFDPIFDCPCVAATGIQVDSTFNAGQSQARGSQRASEARLLYWKKASVDGCMMIKQRLQSLDRGLLAAPCPFTEMGELGHDVEASCAGMRRPERN